MLLIKYANTPTVANNINDVYITSNILFVGGPNIMIVPLT